MSVLPDPRLSAFDRSWQRLRSAGKRKPLRLVRRAPGVDLPPGGVPDQRFEAAVFDWDGTAVASRAADGLPARTVFSSLLAAGFDLAVITGTNVDNVDRQLQLRPHGPGRMLVCVNRGAEVYELGPDGPNLRYRYNASAQEEQLLDAAAALLRERLAERGLETGLVADRLNRRKIDLIPLPEWAEPPKAQLAELLVAVESRLEGAGIVGGLPAAVELAVACAREVGLVDPRVTSDAKYAEIGLTDKTHAARYVFKWLAQRGVRPEQALIVGDELGPLGGCAGSDSLMLLPETAGAVCVSVGPEPNGVPDGVLHLPGGPERFLALLGDQLRRREALELPRFCADPGWQIVLDGEGGADEPLRQTVLTLGDGRYGTRGAALHEAGGQKVVAAGRYAGNGTNEELLACPVWNQIDGARGATLRRVLDLKTGTLRHQLRDSDGSTLEALLFLSLEHPGTACLRAHSDEPALLASRAPLAAPEQPGTQTVVSQVGQVTIAESRNVERVVAAACEQRSEDTLERLACYATDEPGARAGLQTAREQGFERLYSGQRARWGERWRDCEVTIEGAPELEQAVRFNLFGLMIAAGDDGEAAIGARGLSGPGYRGHVFWDTDVYALPFFAATHPAAALAMLRYRLNRLEAARSAAQRSRREGARFPWESTRSGFDVTPPHYYGPDGRLVPIRTGSHEEHITAAVAWAADCYLTWTGDPAFASEARPLFIETARYWASRIRLDRQGRGHIYGVIGPDEYHEPVDDSAYTNVMTRWNLRRAARAAREQPGEDVPPGELEHWLSLADCLVDGHDPATGLYEEFAGFHRLEPLLATEIAERPFAADSLLPLARVRGSQLVKQADVLLLHQLVPDEVEPGSLEPNLDFYEPRTTHGSSLSPAMHALLLARAGRLEQAERYLELAARFDLANVNGSSGFGQHTATQGGVWLALAYGFAGLRPAGDCLELDPKLPAHWQALGLTVQFRGARVKLRFEHGRTLASADEPTLVRRPGCPPVEVGREPVAL